MLARAMNASLKLETKTLRTTLAYARSLAAAGDRKQALSIVKGQLEKTQGDGHPLLRALKANLESDRKVSHIIHHADRRHGRSLLWPR